MSTHSLADYVAGLNIATNKEWLTHQESLALRIAHPKPILTKIHESSYL